MKKTFKIITNYSLVKDNRNCFYVLDNGVERYCELRFFTGKIYVFGYYLRFIRITKKKYRRIFGFLKRGFTVIANYRYKTINQKIT